jgi:hypothetical protein
MTVAAAVAAWMGLGTLHDFHNSDSLLPALISTQRWTPFFWGQDRFGMLVPLVTMPIRDPLANLLAQAWIMTTAALLAPFVIARFLTDRAPEWIAIGACANLLILLVVPPAVQFDWFVTQPYALSMCVGFAALIVAGHNRGAGGAVSAAALFALAGWINIGIAVMLAIAALAGGSARSRLLLLGSAGVLLAALAARYFATEHTVSSLLGAGQWGHAWAQLARNAAAAVVPGALAVAGIAVAGAVLAILVWAWYAGRPWPWTHLAIAAAIGTGTWLVVGTSLWVGMNQYSARYMYPTLMMAAVGVAIVFAAALTSRATAASLALLAAMILAAGRYGMPSYGRVARGIEDRFGRHTAAVIESGATVLAGDYWGIWPAVFHANLTLTRSGAARRVYGLTLRSEETEPLWKTPGRPVLVATAPNDATVVGLARQHGLALTFVARLPLIDLYSGQP